MVLEWQSKVWASYSSGNAFPSLHPWGGVGWPQNRCGWCKQVSCGMSSFSPKRRLHDSHRLISFKEGSESVSSDQQNCIPRFQTPEGSASNYGNKAPSSMPNAASASGALTWSELPLHTPKGTTRRWQAHPAKQTCYSGSSSPRIFMEECVCFPRGLSAA